MNTRISFEIMGFTIFPKDIHSITYWHRMLKLEPNRMEGPINPTEVLLGNDVDLINLLTKSNAIRFYFISNL